MRFSLLILLPFISPNLTAQSDTITSMELQPVTIQAYRLESKDLQTPLAHTRIGSYRLQSGQQQLALQESLQAIPGVFVQNADNFAQDVRISVRGFGSRATFGIRGIKLILDGFPETTPDGQGQADNIDPGMLRSIEVIRGTTGGLYGNASGGYIQFKTLSFGPDEFLEASVRAGSYGFQKYQLQLGGGNPRSIMYSAMASGTLIKGFRDHSENQNYIFNGGVLLPVDSSLYIRAALNYAFSPVAEDPGALNPTDVSEDRKQAWPLNLTQDVSEKVIQGRLGIEVMKYFSEGSSLQIKSFYTNRDFSNKLPGFQGTLKRDFQGVQVQYSQALSGKGWNWQISAGMELENQTDDRERFENTGGSRGVRYEKARERFRNAGLFVSQQWDLRKRIQLYGALRYDHLSLSQQDRLGSVQEEIYRRQYDVVNPMAGISYSIAQAVNLYASWSTSFETPTLNELYNPVFQAFDPVLTPQNSNNLEGGLKGQFPGSGFRYEIAMYRIRTKDEINPVSTDSLGNDIFGNLGGTKRNGLEIGLTKQFGKHWLSFLNLSVTDFTISEFPGTGQSVTGNFLPGLPRNTAYFELRHIRTSGFFGNLQLLYTGKLYADNGNMHPVDPVYQVNVRGGYIIRNGKTKWEIFAGVNNFFNASFYSNIRINAFGNRFYEAAPGRNYVAGISYRIG